MKFRFVGLCSSSPRRSYPGCSGHHPRPPCAPLCGQGRPVPALRIPTGIGVPQSPPPRPSHRSQQRPVESSSLKSVHPVQERDLPHSCSRSPGPCSPENRASQAPVCCHCISEGPPCVGGRADMASGLLLTGVSELHVGEATPGCRLPPEMQAVCPQPATGQEQGSVPSSWKGTASSGLHARTTARTGAKTGVCSFPEAPQRLPRLHSAAAADRQVCYSFRFSAGGPEAAAPLRLPERDTFPSPAPRWGTLKPASPSSSAICFP